MNDIEKTNANMKEPDGKETPNDAVGEDRDRAMPAEPKLWDRVRQILEESHLRSADRTGRSKDRTRPLTLLIVGTVGAVLFFIGVFSTPTRSLLRDGDGHVTPNLGRPRTDPAAPTPGSVTPLLNADVQSQDRADQLSAADIRSTSRRSLEVSGPSNVEEAIPAEATVPIAVYRLDNVAPVPIIRDGRAPVPGVVEPPPAYGGVAPLFNEARPPVSSPVKSSIVFVRASREPGVNAAPAPTGSFSSVALLPPGTRLSARLEAAATTAVQTPVIAAIEYHYEREGIIVVPAGAKVIGEVQQASPEGFLSIRFHTLRMPNGREEMIEAAAVALDHGPLKGAASGRNIGRRIVSQTLTGVGTVAAYIVGAGGSGLNGAVTGEALLRDRLASNVALAGEQALMKAAISQSISVTVPANTRFYVVLQKAAGTANTPVPSQTAEPFLQRSDIPTIQELRELMDLRREINRMYQQSNAASPFTFQ